ncbi:uncharacterized protein LOC112560621 isoform X2 [Pomacea canaliculata]|uniref:uncharacterized protein LOC112560621 isoform X2 n=1 Tax=Pomacea canaliculata TaxID=400727 RepID=UPI000D738365|nr:uncharacterized protein LOC112560621 isoform X2 [Pomacea canaliculata]
MMNHKVASHNVLTVVVTRWHLTSVIKVQRRWLPEVCYQGYTGADSGGSCTFNKGHVCNWESSGFQVNKNSEAFANMYGRNQGARATLTSPWMCEDNFTTICVQFRFMFNDNDGGRLTLKLCHDTRTCEDLWFANSRDKNEWSWYHVNKTVTLTQHEQFQIQFQGEKIEDSWFQETNFYLDNIVYKNTSCTTKPSAVDYSSTEVPSLTTLLNLKCFQEHHSLHTKLLILVQVRLN